MRPWQPDANGRLFLAKKPDQPFANRDLDLGTKTDGGTFRGLMDRTPSAAMPRSSVPRNAWVWTTPRSTVGFRGLTSMVARRRRFTHQQVRLLHPFSARCS